MSKYDNLTAESSVKTNRSDFYLYLQKLMRKQEEERRLHENSLSHQKLAKDLNINYDVFKKIVNKQRPTKSRDFILAIAIVLKLTEEDTDNILLEYDGFPGLDARSGRDEVVVNAINDYHCGEPIDLSIDYVNRNLVDLGYKPLDIIHPRGKNRNVKTNVYDGNYRIIDPDIVNVNVSDLYYGRERMGYSVTYHPSWYRCYGNLYIEHKESKNKYLLTLDLSGKCCVLPMGNKGDFLLCEKISKTGELQSYFAKLRGDLRKESNRIKNQLNDTKNYYERIGVNVEENSIHVFIETYNYNYPEMNEYYLFEILEGKFRLSVFHKSVFMKLYLRDEFSNYYSDYEIINAHDYYNRIANNDINTEKEYALYELFECVEEFDRIINNPRESIERQVKAKLRKTVFLSMKKKVEDIVNELRERKSFARNLDEIYSPEESDRVCDYYSVNEQFECKEVVEYREFIKCDDDVESKEVEEFSKYLANKTNAIFSFEDIGEVEISVDELKLAFELGYSDIKQICSVKSIKGSIDNIF